MRIDYHITEFASGEELIAGLEKTDCQILFLDIEMKGMDGVAAARKLREMNVRWRSSLSLHMLILCFRDTKCAH